MRIRGGFLLPILLAAFLLGGCHSSGQSSDVPETRPSSSPAVATAHFPAFELSVPEGWTERGNLCRLYEGDDTFLLICPLSEDDESQRSLQARCEQVIAEQLELFYNSDFYAGQVTFDYAEYETGSPEQTRVGGVLHNGKTGDDLRFSGVYCARPACCYVYFRTGTSAVDLGLLREVSHDSFRTL